MLKPFKQFVTAALVSTISFMPNSGAATLATVSATSIFLSFDDALAEGNKEKKPKKPNHGAIANELKYLNAAHSLRNGNGHINASANSNIGRIATYGFAEYTAGDATASLANASVGLDDATTYLDNCAALPLGFICDPVTEASSQAIVDGYDMAVSDFMGASVGFDAAGDAIDVKESSDPALEYFNLMLSYGDIAIADASKTIVVGQIDIADVSFDF